MMISTMDMFEQWVERHPLGSIFAALVYLIVQLKIWHNEWRAQRREWQHVGKVAAEERRAAFKELLAREEPKQK